MRTPLQVASAFLISALLANLAHAQPRGSVSEAARRAEFSRNAASAPCPPGTPCNAKETSSRAGDQAAAKSGVASEGGAKGHDPRGSGQGGAGKDAKVGGGGSGGAAKDLAYGSYGSKGGGSGGAAGKDFADGAKGGGAKDAKDPPEKKNTGKARSMNAATMGPVVKADSKAAQAVVPDVTKTPTPGGPVPIPYPNVPLDKPPVARTPLDTPAVMRTPLDRPLMRAEPLPVIKPDTPRPVVSEPVKIQPRPAPSKIDAITIKQNMTR
jgi:hypothetical protein